jgi:hypothetical protein
MADRRSVLQQRLDDLVGRPLYYCAECQRPVSVTPVTGADPIIARPCGPECDGAPILAPRKSILVGEGGMNWQQQVTQTWRQVAAAVTGRCV